MPTAQARLPDVALAKAGALAGHQNHSLRDRRHIPNFAFRPNDCALEKNESDAKTHRTPKALRAKFMERPVVFRESFRSAHASSRRF